MNDDGNDGDDCDGDVAALLMMIMFKLTRALNCNTLLCSKHSTNK